MNSARTRKKARKRTKTFLDCLREFATASVWKQAQTARNQGRRSPRWKTQSLIFVLLAMTWTCGDSAAERFETARAFCVVCQSKRRRPGKTVEGFQKALARLDGTGRHLHRMVGFLALWRWFVGGITKLGWQLHCHPRIHGGSKGGSITATPMTIY